MRIVGGASLSRRCPLERLYRDVRAGLHNPPMDDLVIVGWPPGLSRSGSSTAGGPGGERQAGR